MKKIIIGISIILTLMICGCAPVSKELQEDNSMFVQVEKKLLYRVLYHKDTKVMYTMSTYGQGAGAFCVMVNADGTPMIWDGEEECK